MSRHRHHTAALTHMQGHVPPPTNTFPTPVRRPLTSPIDVQIVRHDRSGWIVLVGGEGVASCIMFAAIPLQPSICLPTHQTLAVFIAQERRKHVRWMASSIGRGDAHAHTPSGAHLHGPQLASSHDGRTPGRPAKLKKATGV